MRTSRGHWEKVEGVVFGVRDAVPLSLEKKGDALTAAEVAMKSKTLARFAGPRGDPVVVQFYRAQFSVHLVQQIESNRNVRHASITSGVGVTGSVSNRHLCHSCG